MKRRTLPQELMLQEMDSFLGPYPLAETEMRTARALERRGIIQVTKDEFGYAYAVWDDEAHADWIHEQEEVE